MKMKRLGFLTGLVICLLHGVHAGFCQTGANLPDRLQLPTFLPETSYGPPIFYTTNGGHSSRQTIGITDEGIENLQVCPFTPYQRLRFRKMIAFIQHRSFDDYPTTITCSFGIYDCEGNAVATSGPIRLGPNTHPLQEVEVSGTLYPGNLYFTAWGASPYFPSIRESAVPDHPMLGVLENAVVDGIVPASFDPAQIVFAMQHSRPLSVTLILDNGDSLAFDGGGGGGYGGETPPRDPTPTPEPQASPTPTPTPALEPDPTPVAVTVTSPTGGEVYLANDYLEIGWTSDLPTAGTGVSFELHTPQGFVAHLGTDWNPDGVGDATVYLPLLPTRSDYRLRVGSLWDPGLDAYSPVFTVMGDLVDVSRPCDGEVWVVGALQSVWWKINPLLTGTAVSIELWNETDKVADLGIGWDPDGESMNEILVPLLVNGSNYRVRVASVWNPTVWKESGALTIRGGIEPEPLASGESAVAPEAWIYYD